MRASVEDWGFRARSLAVARGMVRASVITFVLSLTACADETISGYADPDATYRLVELGGEPFPARATIRFPEEGRLEGDAPCNRWFAKQNVPYPWFEAGSIGATKRGCADLALETAFFEALGAMTLVEVQGPVLILSDDDGRSMVFQVE